jgi:TonB family protein
MEKNVNVSVRRRRLTLGELYGIFIILALMSLAPEPTLGCAANLSVAATAAIPDLEFSDGKSYLADDDLDAQLAEMVSTTEDYLLCCLGRMSLTSCPIAADVVASSAAKARKAQEARHADAARANPPVAAIAPTNEAPSQALAVLTPADVKATVGRYMGRVRFCSAANPDAKGLVALSFMVNPDGSVSNVAIARSTMGDEGIEQCLVRRVSVMRFPQFAGAAKNVTFPFTFGS